MSVIEIAAADANVKYRVLAHLHGREALSVTLVERPPRRRGVIHRPWFFFPMRQIVLQLASAWPEREAVGLVEPEQALYLEAVAGIDVFRIAAADARRGAVHLSPNGLDAVALPNRRGVAQAVRRLCSCREVWYLSASLHMADDEVIHHVVVEADGDRVRSAMIQSERIDGRGGTALLSDVSWTEFLQAMLPNDAICLAIAFDVRFLTGEH